MVEITPDSKVLLRQQVRCYETDSLKRLKPAAFMDMAQEMAYLAAEAMHFGYDELQAEGKAWVLSRFHIAFNEPVFWRDSLEIRTWHKGSSGPFFLRDFEVLKDGRPVIRATSSWVILDVAARRLCRTSEVTGMIPESTVCHDDAIADPAPKLAMPRGCEPLQCAVHRVRYSDTDLIGHTNNARYVVWAMDCLEYDSLMAKPLKDLQVNFIHETKAGDEVVLFRSEDGTAIYVEGRCADRQAFCVKFGF